MSRIFVEDEDYSIMEAEGGLPSPFRLLTGNYAGTIFMFGRVQIIEQAPPEPPILKFSYQVLESPDNISKERLDSDANFKNYIGDLLAHIIEEAYLKHETRESDSTQSDKQQ